MFIIFYVLIFFGIGAVFIAITGIIKTTKRRKEAYRCWEEFQQESNQKSEKPLP